MKKDAYYFSHDSNSKDDPKCMLLIDQLGLEGYGIFWVLVEILRDQPDYKYPVELIPIIARRYNTSKEKMLAVVNKYNLFEFDDHKNFFSLSLNNRMEHLEHVREKRRMAGIASGKVRKQKALNMCSTSVQDKLNKNEQSKVKKSKVNNNISHNFYKNQIESNQIETEIDNYLKFYDILKGVNSDDGELSGLLGMEKQVTFKNFTKLLIKSKQKGKKFSDIMPTMNNDKKYFNKISLSRTLHTWLNNDF